MRDRFHWARLLAYVTGLVNQELLLNNEYLVAENRILRAHLPTRLRLSDPERSTLAEIGKRQLTLREVQQQIPFVLILVGCCFFLNLKQCYRLLGFQERAYSFL